MNELLPLGWTAVEFRELVALAQNGLSARRGAGVPTVVLRLADVDAVTGTVATDALRAIGLSSAQREKYALMASDLLAIRVNGSPHLAGALLRFPGPPGWAYCDHFIRFRLHAGVDPQFVAWAFQHRPVRCQIELEMVSSAGQHTVSQRSYAKVVVPTPPSNEQRRIVAEIEKHFTRLDEAVATLKAVEAKLKRARASVLKAAVEGRLVPTEAALARAEGRSYEPASALLERILAERRTRWPKGKKYQPPAELKTDDLPDLPTGWSWATLGQVSVLIRNGYSKKPLAVGVTRILRISAVRPMSVDANDCRWLPEPIEAYVDSRVEPGDLLFTRYNGTRSLVGVCGMLRGSEPMIHPDKLIRVIPVAPLVSAAYLEKASNSGSSRAFVEGMIRTTAGQAGVSGADIKNVPVPLPPLAEQIRIVAEVERRLSVIDNLERTVQQNLARCGRLRQSILKHAFEGKLVPQDPADEPASVLLARIRAQREAEAHA